MDIVSGLFVHSKYENMNLELKEPSMLIDNVSIREILINCIKYPE